MIHISRSSLSLKPHPGIPPSPQRLSPSLSLSLPPSLSVYLLPLPPLLFPPIPFSLSSLVPSPTTTYSSGLPSGIQVNPESTHFPPSLPVVFLVMRQLSSLLRSFFKTMSRAQAQPGEHPSP